MTIFLKPFIVLNYTFSRILQSHCGALHVEDNSNISVSTPPILDISFKQTATGDKCIDVLMERTRLNLSVSFLLDFTRFILDALPLDNACEGGLVNHGYIGDTTQVIMEISTQILCIKLMYFITIYYNYYFLFRKRYAVFNILVFGFLD